MIIVVNREFREWNELTAEEQTSVCNSPICSYFTVSPGIVELQEYYWSWCESSKYWFYWKRPVAEKAYEERVDWVKEGF